MYCDITCRGYLIEKFELIFRTEMTLEEKFHDLAEKYETAISVLRISNLGKKELEAELKKEAKQRLMWETNAKSFLKQLQDLKKATKKKPKQSRGSQYRQIDLLNNSNDYFSDEDVKDEFKKALKRPLPPSMKPVSADQVQ